MKKFRRFHLILEETAEMMLHINKGELNGTCDGFGDLCYVVNGIAVDYILPAKEIIQEVCRSNNTKAPRDIKNNPRLRDKGENFSPPNFNEILISGRKRLKDENQI
jgi:predicted HAD superfamily Cof-like phosphohydrolase